MNLITLTRPVSDSFARCELTHLARAPIDVAVAAAQHEAYEQCLRDLSCQVVRLPAEPDLPDAVFVEDAAIVLDELAVVTRPGAASRRPETTAVASALEAYRPVRRIDVPGTLDGGDVLRLGRVLFVGCSTRTNAAGIDQLRELVRPFGYAVEGVEVGGCLHLKSAVTEVADGVLLINRDWIDARSFVGMSLIDVDPGEPAAANALRLGDVIVYPQAFERTRERLEQRGLEVRTVDVSELAKAEGGVTCCSLVLRR